MAGAQGVAAVLTALLIPVTASAQSTSVDDVLSRLHAGGHVIVLVEVLHASCALNES